MTDILIQKGQLQEDIKKVTQDLQILHGIKKKTKGVYIRIDYLENLLTDMVIKERELE